MDKILNFAEKVVCFVWKTTVFYCGKPLKRYGENAEIFRKEFNLFV